ncbi:hypothetical protein GCM10029978_060950 [Actinoallomurus acanthiterrae]
MTEATRSARKAARSATRPLEEATERLPGGELLKGLPTDRLLNEVQGLITAMGTRALLRLIARVEGAADRLGDYSEHGEGGLLSALTGGAGGGLLSAATKGKGGGLLSAVTKGGGGRLLSALAGGGEGGSLKDRLAPGFNALKAYTKTKIEQKARGGKGGKGKKLKVTNIVETLDVGVPLRLAYDQWTRFEDFPSFTKKVEDVHQESDEKVRWKAHILWSHRDWESTIIEQVPDRRIVWRSKGPKGYVDGAVTFSEIGPDLTRIALVLEYHPKGFFEYTGNLWRAQGRRARLEFKHFQRHAMTQAILRPDEIEGWRGEIHDGQVVKDHETALREEQEAEGRRNASARKSRNARGGADAGNGTRRRSPSTSTTTRTKSPARSSGAARP